MYIGGAIDDTLIKHQIDEAYYRGRVRGRFHRSDVVGISAGKAFVVSHPLAEGLDHVGDGLARIAVVLGDTVHYVLLSREDEANLLGEGEEHFVGDSRIDQIECGERYRSIVSCHGEDVVHSGRRGGYGFGHIGLNGQIGEIYRLGILIGGHRRQEIVFGEHLLIDDRLADALALGLGDILQIFCGIFVKITVLDENLEYRV